MLTTVMFRLVLFSLLGFSQSNLVSNPGFESTDYGWNWDCQGSCTLSPSFDARTGLYSAKISQRYRVLVFYFHLLRSASCKIDCGVQLIFIFKIKQLQNCTHSY